MATEENNGSTGETQVQEQQGQQNGTTDEKSGNGDQQQATIDDSTQLPETHPLVKTLASQKAALATAKQELTESRAKSAKVTELEEQIKQLPTTEAMTTLQTRYDRLEAFAQAVGLGKALDSRTFTRDLFETDKDIKTLVTEYNRANPSETARALARRGGESQGTGKIDPNVLIRASIQK